MKIFSENERLKRLFLAGKAPEPVTLLGPDSLPAQWRVRMLTGLIPNMGGPQFRHRKLFVPGVTIGGCNVLFSDFRWGWFQLEKDTYSVEAGGDDEPVLLINYDVKKNNCVTGRIRDYVRATMNPNVLIGRFHYMWRGRPRFLGYFTLTRITVK